MDKLFPCVPAQFLNFGRSVAVDGNTVVVGSTEDQASSDGAVYSFRSAGAVWASEAKMVQAASSGDFRLLGSSVDLDGRNVIAGAIDGLPTGGAPDINASGACLFDLLCLADTNDDGVVNVTDLVNVLLDWSPAPITHGGDVTCDGVVNVQDMVQVILAWNSICGGATAAGPSLCQTFLDAGLSQEDCDRFRSFLSIDDVQYRCWLVHYLTTCSTTCGQPPSCGGRDPFNTGRH
jgi:hypothetical protein